MKKCPRCDVWHHSPDSNICETCWEDMGQMSFWQDQDDDDGLDRHPIDTIFDQDREQFGRDW